MPIRTSGGHAYRGDLVIPSRKVVIEYQSRFHESPVDFRKHMTRISRLEADGRVVIQVNADDLDDPEELVARIRRVLDARPVVA
jgi:very-short-patch-repair endonuclease